jgi:hypothetical protein
MKNLLNFLPSWPSVKALFNVIYYLGFIFWFGMNAYNMSFNDCKITNEQLFTAIMFLSFAILDRIEVNKDK